MALSEREKMVRGELFLAFSPELVKERNRERVQAWREIVGDTRPLPPAAATPDEDENLFENDAWVWPPINVEPPVHIDYGKNVKLGHGVFLNFNSVFVDTCEIEIGARTLVGPNCSFYSGMHPLDPVLRNGTKGPELGKPISIGEDCWFGGDVKVMPGVKIGRGSVIGAGSVVTKDVPDFHVVAGNPARILRKIETSMDPSGSSV